MSFLADMTSDAIQGFSDLAERNSYLLDIFPPYSVPHYCISSKLQKIPWRTHLRSHGIELAEPFLSTETLHKSSPTGKEGFQVLVNVRQFQPNEITVKTVENQIVVEAKHEEREDHHGTISRQITRKFRLPQGYDPEHVTSSLSSDGILTVKAPKPTESSAKERTIEIQHTGPAHLSVKPNSQEADEKQHQEKPSAHHEKNHQKK